MRERVANLESLVKTLVQKADVDVDEQASSEKSVINEHAASDVELTNPSLDHAPIMSLFNNNIIDGRAEPESREHAIGMSLSERSKPKDQKVRQKLLKYVPSDKDIELIWDECSYWWYVWSRMFPELSVKGSESICQYTKSSIRGGTVLALSKTLLCLALALQQLTATFIKEKLNLPIPADQMIYHYISTIEKYVFGDDRYLTTLEGLELTIILTKINANAGRPRKAWLQFRRAISFALLLGLNRKTMWQVTSSDTTTGPRRRAVFWALYQGDRYFSLILGLPYSLSDQQCDIKEITRQNMDMRGIGAEHMFRLSNLGGRLIDRCQSPDLVSLATTMKWEEELKEASQSLPSLTTVDAIKHLQFDELYDRSLALLFHHYIRTLLHLPFMLKSSSDRSFEYNRIAAVESARKMIHSFRVLRQGIHGGYCACKTIDFQVFLGCILLVLNQLAFAPMSGRATETQEDLEDWKLVEDVRDILATAARESLGTNGAMQDSAVKTLNLLMDARYCGDEACGSLSTKISIPYFGTITVSPRKEAMVALDRIKTQMITPSQTTVSSCASPKPQSWPQLPTPPQGFDTLSTFSTNSESATPAANPYIAFDPVNIPLPAGFNSSSNVADTADFAFTDPLLTGDWANGVDWSNLTGSGIDLDLDNEWKWVTSNNPMLMQQQQPGSSMPNQGMTGSEAGPNLT